MIRVGIGGWTYAPWRGLFYPVGLPQSRELHYASRHLTAIEINGTFYRTQTPASFRKWAGETPDDFVFSVKAPRYATSRRVLAEAGEAIERFAGSGLSELGPKLGPVNWQFPPSKKFDADDVAAFLALLPREADGLRLRHALEVRHESFAAPEFLTLAREAGVAVVFADSGQYPRIEEQTADFTYVRLMRAREDIATGYPPDELQEWVKQAQAWSRVGRDVFVYFIDGYKPHAPAAALAFLSII